MTTLVVAKKSGMVCIAAETQTTHGDLKLASKYECNATKIVSYNKSFIGIAGSAAHEMTLLGALRKKQYDLNSRQAIFDSFSVEAKKVFLK